jgi:eukaryotic-like serine/threonine-protein kinase
MDHLTETTLPPSAVSPEPPGPSMDLTGRTLGDYHVLRRLGEGGMGSVYLAEQISLKRRVALKLLKADLAGNPTALQRFKAEAEAVARATHANIVQVYQIGEQDGVHYMALEYVEGRSLRDYLVKKGPPELLVALSIMRQCASALQRAAELGIIHRDIKPENILLSRKGEVKIADFGLSRDVSGDGQPLNLTRSGVTMGTPLYMSPEQVQGQRVDARTDIYSLGVTCYCMLAGHPPFRGANAFDVAIQHIQSEPPPLASNRPDLPKDLCALVHRMLAKNPDDRYQSGRDLLRDLVRVREAVTGMTNVTASHQFADLGDSPKTVVETRPPAAGRRRLVVAVAIVATLMAAPLLGVAFGWYYRLPASSPLGNGGNDPAATEPTTTSQQKREQSLKDVFHDHLNPGKDPQKVATGYNLALELGLFYLDQKRWDDADQFFGELISNNPGHVEGYTYLGKLGQAVVLGLKSHYKESSDQFKALLPEKPEGTGGRQPSDKPDKRDAALRNPKLRQWIGEALEYNYRNDKANFPPKLEVWRKPPGTGPK